MYYAYKFRIISWESTLSESQETAIPEDWFTGSLWMPFYCSVLDLWEDWRHSFQKVENLWMFVFKDSLMITIRTMTAHWESQRREENRIAMGSIHGQNSVGGKMTLWHNGACLDCCSLPLQLFETQEQMQFLKEVYEDHSPPERGRDQHKGCFKATHSQTHENSWPHGLPAQQTSGRKCEKEKPRDDSPFCQPQEKKWYFSKDP